MDAEQLSTQQIDQNKEVIARAMSLMASMKTLKQKLHLSDGAGQRFLQKTNPDLALLQQAEQEIAAAYSDASGKSPQGNSGNNRRLLNNIARRGQA